MGKNLLSIAIILLSISIFFTGFQINKIDYSINNTTELNSEKGLMTLEETEIT